MLGGARIALVVACGLLGALSCANSSHPLSKTDAGSGSGGGKGSGGNGGASSGTDASADIPVTSNDSGTAPDAPAGTVMNGKPCTADNQCGSGFCTDGVCCETACHETCWTCSAQGTVGSCVPADVGTDPRSDCQDDGLASCGNDGTCDGSGACRRYPTGTICRQPTCSGSTLTLASRCQAGVCQPTSGLPCDPYVCDSKAGNACLRTCTGNADCGSGNICNVSTGSCGKTPVGVSCTTNDDCNSNLCQQGICCQTACTDLCMSCAVPQGEGKCTAVPAGNDPLNQCAPSAASTCGADGFCDGKGACEIYSKATVCKDPTCTAGGAVGTAAARCDGMGTCAAAAAIACNEYMCGTNGACLVTCRTNTDCSPGNVCNGGICGKKILGATCVANTECATGTCQQGVCCDKVCTGTCLACNQASSLGHCLPLPLGPAPAGQCTPADPSTCGNDGNCDGTGKCHLQTTGTICKAATCSLALQTLAARCDGVGTCVNGTTQPCDPFQCGASGACLGTCNPANGNGDCTTGNVCTPNVSMPATGSCGKKPLGAGCTLPGECGSNLCEGGTCCDMPCSGTCKSCSLAGSAGKCSNVPAGQDPLDQCPVDAVSTCKRDGLCDGNGACRNYAAATVCVASTCTSATFTTQRTCDGAGTCAPATTGTCAGSFACDTTNGVCKTSCSPATSSTDCASPATCSGTACVLKANGIACGTANECATGFCEQGICCASACQGTCRSCALPGATTLGVCSNVPAATLDARCPTTATSTCGTDGTCDGNGACHLYANTTQCAGGLCPTGTATQTNPRTCDGAGNCAVATTKACSPFLCDGVSACKTTCTVATSGTDCLAPNTCLGAMCGKKQTGVSCMIGGECASGFCSQSVCCDKDCSGTCQSCVLAGKVGTCSLIPAGSPPLVQSQCPAATPSTCLLDGTCDGSGNCRNYPSGTTCVNQICSSGNTLVQPRLCNGGGTCQTSTSGACPGSFNCNTGTNACRIACTVGTQATDCTSPAVCTGNICGTVRVQYMCADTNAKTQSPHPQFKLINLSATPINLSTLTIRYWFTGDGAVTFGGAIDFASNSAGTQIQSQMSLTFVSVSRTGADHYMQINYGAGAGTLTNASPVFAQSRFNSTNPDFGITFTQTGDYSFDPTKTALADWVQVTVYQNGVLIWGIEPS
jgi:hypothetical protein